jgi:hypothetical protein
MSQELREKRAVTSRLSLKITLRKVGVLLSVTAVA